MSVYLSVYTNLIRHRLNAYYSRNTCFLKLDKNYKKEWHQKDNRVNKRMNRRVNKRMNQKNCANIFYKFLEIWLFSPFMGFQMLKDNKFLQLLCPFLFSISPSICSQNFSYIYKLNHSAVNAVFLIIILDNKNDFS